MVTQAKTKLSYNTISECLANNALSLKAWEV